MSNVVEKRYEYSGDYTNYEGRFCSANEARESAIENGIDEKSLDVRECKGLRIACGSVDYLASSIIESVAEHVWDTNGYEGNEEYLQNVSEEQIEELDTKVGLIVEEWLNRNGFQPNIGVIELMQCR